MTSLECSSEETSCTSPKMSIAEGNKTKLALGTLSPSATPTRISSPGLMPLPVSSTPTTTRTLENSGEYDDESDPEENSYLQLSNAFKLLAPFGIDDRCVVALRQYRQLVAEVKYVSKDFFVDHTAKFWTSTSQSHSEDTTQSQTESPPQNLMIETNLRNVYDAFVCNDDNKTELSLELFSMALSLINTLHQTSFLKKALKKWLRWCYALFDSDFDGYTTREEFCRLIEALNKLLPLILPACHNLKIRSDIQNLPTKGKATEENFVHAASRDASIKAVIEVCFDYIASSNDEKKASSLSNSRSLPLFLTLLRDAPFENSPPPTKTKSPSKKKVFANQVAGHKGKKSMLKHGNTICKPLNETEHAFYEMLNSELKSNTTGLPLDITPKYFGVQKIEDPDNNIEEEYIVLEDLTGNMEKPSIVDIKMGFDSDPTAGLKKKIKQKYYNLTTTSSTLGFRIVGMQVFHPVNNKYLKKDAYWGIKIKQKAMKDALKLFFHNGQNLRYDVIEAMLPKLKDISEWMKSQKSFLFMSSSILLVYDGVLPPPGESPKVAAKMIDFAHCIPMNAQDHDHYQIRKSYIKGMKRLRKLLKEIKKEFSEEEVIVYEHQRRQLISAQWAPSSLLPPWADKNGKRILGLNYVELGYGWEWTSEWTYCANAETDSDGWEYSSNVDEISPIWVPQESIDSVVRRRIWRRVRKRKELQNNNEKNVGVS